MGSVPKNLSEVTTSIFSARPELVNWTEKTEKDQSFSPVSFCLIQLFPASASDLI